MGGQENRKIKLWLVQMQPELGSSRHNAEKIVEYIRLAGEAEVQLVAFPELALTGYECDHRFFELAEPIPGPSTRQIEKQARLSKVYAVFGMPELSGSCIYNSAPLFGPDGLVGIWRKLVLATFWTQSVIYREGMFFHPGNDIVTFDTQFGKIGVLICRDIVYAEISRVHSYRGALLNLCLSAVTGSIPERFHVYGRSRAQENFAWIGYVNQVGVQETLGFTGGSCVIAPSNEIVKVASYGNVAKEEFLEHEIDLEATLRLRLTSTVEKVWRTDILRKASDAVSNL